jgi:hypothetical protein
MSFTVGPLAVAAGVPRTLTNPAAGAGNLTSDSVVVVNLSPFELIITGGIGTFGVVDPYTRDLVTLDPEAGQQIVITPMSIGTLATPGPSPVIFATWYQATEGAPGNYPTPIAVPNAGTFPNFATGIVNLSTNPSTMIPSSQNGIYLFRWGLTNYSGAASSSIMQLLDGNGTCHDTMPVIAAGATQSNPLNGERFVGPIQISPGELNVYGNISYAFGP